jgi:hypothetical protein
MIIGNRDVKSTAKSLDPASLEESFKEMQQKEDEKAETAELGSSPPAKLSLGTPISELTSPLLRAHSPACRVCVCGACAVRVRCVCRAVGFDIRCVCTGMRERKDTWIKPKTTYCKDVDVFRSAVDDRNQFNGEWFTQIQLTVKKEMAWINDGTAVL